MLLQRITRNFVSLYIILKSEVFRGLGGNVFDCLFSISYCMFTWTIYCINVPNCQTCLDKLSPSNDSNVSRCFSTMMKWTFIHYHSKIEQSFPLTVKRVQIAWPSKLFSYYVLRKFVNTAFIIKIIQNLLQRTLKCICDETKKKKRSPKRLLVYFLARLNVLIHKKPVEKKLYSCTYQPQQNTDEPGELIIGIMIKPEVSVEHFIQYKMYKLIVKRYWCLAISALVNANSV